MVAQSAHERQEGWRAAAAMGVLRLDLALRRGTGRSQQSQQNCERARVPNLELAVQGRRRCAVPPLQQEFADVSRRCMLQQGLLPIECTAGRRLKQRVDHQYHRDMAAANMDITRVYKLRPSGKFNQESTGCAVTEGRLFQHMVQVGRQIAQGGLREGHTNVIAPPRWDRFAYPVGARAQLARLLASFGERAKEMMTTPVTKRGCRLARRMRRTLEAAKHAVAVGDVPTGRLRVSEADDILLMLQADSLERGGQREKSILAGEDRTPRSPRASGALAGCQSFLVYEEAASEPSPVHHPSTDSPLSPAITGNAQVVAKLMALNAKAGKLRQQRTVLRRLENSY
mmetsp:Transcript_9222/g.22172  ORF Transcript_9222/g.22172 Transcript_9222/m.22172 type:complete len:342 (-) Transcript_9222:196-1221(-)